MDKTASFWEKGFSPFPFPEVSVETNSICGNLCLTAAGVVETVREILECIFPLRASLDRERQKSIAGDEGGRVVDY